jgi:hypothetical protein
VSKVLSQCPLVLLIEVRRRKGKVLGSGLGKILGNQPCYERRKGEVGQGFTVYRKLRLHLNKCENSIITS